MLSRCCCALACHLCYAQFFALASAYIYQSTFRTDHPAIVLHVIRRVASQRIDMDTAGAVEPNAEVIRICYNQGGQMCGSHAVTINNDLSTSITILAVLCRKIPESWRYGKTTYLCYSCMNRLDLRHLHNLQISQSSFQTLPVQPSQSLWHTHQPLSASGPVWPVQGQPSSMPVQKQFGVTPANMNATVQYQPSPLRRTNLPSGMSQVPCVVPRGPHAGVIRRDMASNQRHPRQMNPAARAQMLTAAAGWASSGSRTGMLNESARSTSALQRTSLPSRSLLGAPQNVPGRGSRSHSPRSH